MSGADKQKTKDSAATYLADDDRACRECRRGMKVEAMGDGRMLYSTCDACGGSGSNSIRIGGRLS